MTVSKQTDIAAQGKRQAARWSLISNSALLILKAFVGIVTGSVGILAEVVNSAGDLTGSLVAWFSVKVSDEPPDLDHAYGHGKIENISGAFTAALVLVGGVYAIWQALRELVHPTPLVKVNWGVVVMVISALVNLVVSWRLLNAARSTDSPALAADGRHLRTDVLTSLGVLLGLVLVRATGQRWWDSLAAILVSLLILRLGYGLAADAINTLSDTALPPEEEQILKEALVSHPGVLGFHKLRTRKSGSHRHVDVHVQIADTQTFVEAHRLTEELEDMLRTCLPNLHPMIHIEPFEDEEAHQREEQRAGVAQGMKGKRAHDDSG